MTCPRSRPVTCILEPLTLNPTLVATGHKYLSATLHLSMELRSYLCDLHSRVRVYMKSIERYRIAKSRNRQAQIIFSDFFFVAIHREMR